MLNIDLNSTMRTCDWIQALIGCTLLLASLAHAKLQFVLQGSDRSPTERCVAQYVAKDTLVIGHYNVTLSPGTYLNCTVKIYHLFDTTVYHS